MKQNIKFIVLLLALCSFKKISCSDALLSFAKSVGTASFWEGMGTTFGAPPVGYTYSFQVISDASVDMYIGLEGMASFMGASFPSSKGLYNTKTLQSIFNAPSGPSAKAVYNDQNYYFNLYMSDSSNLKNSSIYSQAFTQIPLAKHDPNTYYYHMYTGKSFSHGNLKHSPQVEMLGYQNASAQGDAKGNVTIGSQLSAIILYNSSDNDAQLQMNYGSTPYTFTLEKNSYNTLNVPMTTDTSGASTPSFSLRPNKLSFSVYNATSKKYEHLKDLVLPSDGFNGCTYTIELFDDGQGSDICIQGLTPGNYDQMVSPKSRDLTPCSSLFWYKSVVQSPVGDGFIDLPGQVWIAYQGADSMIMSKVDVGKVVSWNLVRPCLSQHDQYLYFIYVATADDVKAQKFIQQALAKKLSKDQINQYKSMIQNSLSTQSSTATIAVTTQQQSSVVSGTLSSTTGIITDTVQDLYGYLVGIDTFTAKGVGNGNFYYVLPPLVVNSSNLVQLLSGCVDSSKLPGSKAPEDIQKILGGVVIDWLKNYIQNAKDVAGQVQDYLMKYGNKTILDSKGSLTDYGKKQLTTILQGPMSLKYPPMKLSTVLNQYVYDFGKSKPDGLPEGVTQLSAVAQL